MADNSNFSIAARAESVVTNIPTVNIQVIFYSMFGHVYKLAGAIVAGAKQLSDANVNVTLYQVAELVPEEALIKSGAQALRQQFAHIPLAAPEQLAAADAVIFGTPTRFGNMCAQMRNFFDQTGGVWAKGELIGKIGSVFASTGTQHGGQETTLTSVHTTLLHHGMIVVGVPYALPELMNTLSVSGGSPYGATTIAGSDGARQPSEDELNVARYQGRHVAEIARALKVGRA